MSRLDIIPNFRAAQTLRSFAVNADSLPVMSAIVRAQGSYLETRTIGNSFDEVNRAPVTQGSLPYRHLSQHIALEAHATYMRRAVREKTLRELGDLIARIEFPLLRISAHLNYEAAYNSGVQRESLEIWTLYGHGAEIPQGLHLEESVLDAYPQKNNIAMFYQTTVELSDAQVCLRKWEPLAAAHHHKAR